MYKIELNDNEYNLLQFLVWTYTNHYDNPTNRIKNFFEEDGFIIKDKKYYIKDIEDLWDKLIITKYK